VISEPPSLDGADHDTAAEESPATPETPVGGSGTVAGVGSGVTAFGLATSLELTTHREFFAVVFDSNLS
jgi:hypothetical protein